MTPEEAGHDSFKILNRPPKNSLAFQVRVAAECDVFPPSHDGHHAAEHFFVEERGIILPKSVTTCDHARGTAKGSETHDAMSEEAASTRGEHDMARLETRERVPFH
jgi:hypothetical protein